MNEVNASVCEHIGPSGGVKPEFGEIDAKRKAGAIRIAK
jgi:hypothetical protein